MKRVAEIKIKVIPLQPGSQPNTIFDNLTFSIMQTVNCTLAEFQALESLALKLGYTRTQETFLSDVMAFELVYTTATPCEQVTFIIKG